MKYRKIGHFLAAMFFLCSLPVLSQIKDRNIDEIKEESLYRAENGGAYPLIGLEVPDVKEALGMIKTRNPDEWASAWSKVAEKYMRQAQQASSPE